MPKKEKNIHSSYKLGNSGIVLRNVDVQDSYIGKAKHGRGRPAKFTGTYAGRNRTVMMFYNSMMYIHNNNIKGTMRKVKWELYIDVVDELIKLDIIDNLTEKRKRILATMLYTALM